MIIFVGEIAGKGTLKNKANFCKIKKESLKPSTQLEKEGF